MASLRPGNYVVVVLPVGGSKASNMKLVFQRVPRNDKAWFLAGSILPIEAHVEVAVRELFEEVGLTLTVDDATLLSGNHVRVPLSVGEHQFVHIFSASVLAPFVTTNLHVLAKV
jgi:8-oxo-dGTP pyrophosphatase MutT (NUDIX family)